ncbi:unnamed protein product [Amaranthus hypochondriacus]
MAYTDSNDYQSAHLPHDLIVHHILPWLPIKSLMQYKLVSKQWYSSISSPSFIKTHLKLTPFSDPFTPLESLIIQSGHGYYLYECDDNHDLENGVQWQNLIQIEGGYMFRDTYLVGSSNGLVCLAHYKNEYFILWNPTTTQHRIHYPDEGIGNQKPNFINWGFGYVSSENDHKVIRISLIWANDRFINTVHVYSLRFNRWKKIKFGLDHYFFPQRARLVHGFLYWAWNCKSTDSIKLVSFDLYREKFEIVHHLDLSSESDMLCVMGGCLSKCTCNPPNGLKIDILKCSFGVCSVDVQCDLTQTNFVDLVGFTKTGKILLVDDGNRRILRLDFGSETDQSVAILCWCGKDTRIDGYVPSAVSPYPSPELGQVPSMILCAYTSVSLYFLILGLLKCIIFCGDYDIICFFFARSRF